MSSSHHVTVSTPLWRGRCLLLAVVLTATPRLAVGQGMPGGMNGGMGGMGQGGGGGGGRRHASGGRQSHPDADQRRTAADSIMEQRGFAAFVLDHAPPINAIPWRRSMLLFMPAQTRSGHSWIVSACKMPAS